ncbi:MAG: hypothetical protein PHR96_03275 [Clostridia bacterium]|nr:hypothetical protein [Clostridia bacterium]
MRKKSFGISNLVTVTNYNEFNDYIKSRSDFCKLEISNSEYIKIISFLQSKCRLSEYKRILMFIGDSLLLQIKHLKELGTRKVVALEQNNFYKPVQKENETEEEKANIDKQIESSKVIREKTKKQFAVISFYEMKKQKALRNQSEIELARN